MAEFVSGDVVVVPFPFTDLQSSKRRPAVVLATFARGDLLICQITSRSESHPTAVAIGTDDFLRGGTADSPVGSETPRQPREARRLSKVSRGDWIRTSDLYVPNVAL